jgi:hypothetical protein
VTSDAKSEVIDLCDSGESKTEEKEDYAAVPPEHYNNSFDPEYEVDPTNPCPGDLVITSLSDMRHPARRDVNFGAHYLIVGSVVGFKQVGIDVVEAWKQGVTFKHYKAKERLYVDWMPIQSSNVRFIQVSRKNKVSDWPYDNIDNHFVALQTTPPKHLHVIKKRNSGDLQDVNDFLWQPIGRFFTWSSVYGWRYEPHRNRRLTVV